MTTRRRSRSRRRIPALAAWLALLACGAPERAVGPPNVVVVIVIDTLRPDHLGLYGYERETAPFLADLAARSALFTRAFATSTWTAPSTASIFTSLFPLEHGVVEGLMVHERRAVEVARTGKTVLPLSRIPDDLQTLPVVFRDAGYETTGLGANVNIGPEMGFDRGFDRFERLHGSSAEEIFDRLKRWDAGFDPSTPKLVYLHFDDVHEPYNRRAPWFEESGDTLADLESAYDSEIAYLDGVLRRMFDHFDWNEEATVVIASDHGEEFMEHGELGHGLSLYRELLQVLLLVRAPGKGWEGRRIESNVTTLDILPTLAELAGLEIRTQWQGRSLVPLLEGAAPASPRTLFSHRSLQEPERRELWAAVSGDWHLLERGGDVELYHLENDPEEQLDLSDARRDVTERLTRELEDFRASARARRRTVPIEIEVDDEKLEELRALGYAE